jgi:hypothetical protein
MKLSDISAEPKLIEITLDDKATVKEFGEALSFYTWDRQPMDVFMQLANTDGSNASKIVEVVRNLILNEDGKPVLSDKKMLPTAVLMKAITKVTEQLGK